MALTVATPPSGYPITLDEIRAWIRLGAGNQERAPDAPTVALAGAGAGNVDNGLHRYLVTFVTAAGETEAGTPSAGVTVSDKTANGKVALTAIPVGGTAVTSRRLWRTTAGGSSYLLLATLADNTTTSYVDNVADASLGAGAPSANTTDDPVLTLLAASVTAHAEAETRRALLTQTLDLTLDQFPAWEITIPRPPLQSVSSISYVDTDGQTQVLDSARYLVDTKSEPGRVTPAYGGYWPIARYQHNAVTVRYVAGYGAAAAVPPCVKHWMQVRLAALELNRESIVVEPSTNLIRLPRDFIDGLLDPVRVTSFEWAV